jgi:hypothetical protein
MNRSSRKSDSKRVGEIVRVSRGYVFTAVVGGRVVTLYDVSNLTDDDDVMHRAMTMMAVEHRRLVDEINAEKQKVVDAKAQSKLVEKMRAERSLDLLAHIPTEEHLAVIAEEIKGV